MWKKRDIRIVDVYKNYKTNQEHHSNSSLVNDCTNKKVSARPTGSKRIYPGNDFDVFGKEETEEQFAPLYSIEQFTPKHNKQKESYKKGENLLQPEHEFKRGQVEAIKMIKKRKVIDPIPSHVFIKSTASANTPIALIFKPSKQLEDDTISLAYS